MLVTLRALGRCSFLFFTIYSVKVLYIYGLLNNLRVYIYIDRINLQYNLSELMRFDARCAYTLAELKEAYKAGGLSIDSIHGLTRGSIQR